MVKNNYYYVEYLDIPYLFLYADDKENKFININGVYNTSSWAFWNRDSSAKNLRLATNEEIAWLSACIKAKRFINRYLIKYKQIYELW